MVFEPAEPSPPPEAPRSADTIFSEKTRRALSDAFAKLEPEPEPRPAYAPRVAAPVEGNSVEAVFERAVREAFEPVVNEWLASNADAIVERMKPMIREWMDERFPEILENAIRDEVARVARVRSAAKH